LTALAFKLLVALLASAGGLWALRSRRLQVLPPPRFVAALLALQLIPALTLFVLLYVVGHQEVTADVPAYYVPASKAVLSGQIPFLDFQLSYAPLFPYVGAGLLALWNSGKVFALFAILLNAAALLMWHASARACFDTRTVREASILYATSAQVLLHALIGTNQAWVATAIAGSVLLIIRNRSFSSGFVQGLSFCTTKFLALLFWPVAWMFAPDRLKWVAGAATLSLVVYGGFAAMGADLLYPIRHEATFISPGNLPYLLEPLLGLDGARAYRIFDLVTLVALGSVTLWLLFNARSVTSDSRRNALSVSRNRVLFPSLALTALVFMLFSKKSFPGYAVFCMYPVMLVLTSRLQSFYARTGLFTLFNLTLAVESSLWFYLGGNTFTLGEWLRVRHGLAIEGFIALDVALVSCYATLAWLAVGWLREQRALSGHQAEAVGSGASAGGNSIALDHMQGS
jgi:hypothetical protein